MMFFRSRMAPGEDFPCSFFLPTMKGNLGDKFAWCLDFQESRADDEFSAVELQMPRSWMGDCFSPFFRSHRRERLAELKFGKLLRRRLREWQRCERAVCHAIQWFFFSGENNDEQWTPLLWLGTQKGLLTSSATIRRSSHKGWNPFKTAGENVSSKTNLRIY